MSEKQEEERTVIREATVTFNYKVVKVNNKEFNDVYNVLYVTIKDLNGKEIEFNYVMGDEYTTEEIIKDLAKLNELFPLAYRNDKVLEGLREEVMKKIADLIWKM
jgi:TolB-like protein